MKEVFAKQLEDLFHRGELPHTNGAVSIAVRALIERLYESFFADGFFWVEEGMGADRLFVSLEEGLELGIRHRVRVDVKVVEVFFEALFRTIVWKSRKEQNQDKKDHSVETEVQEMDDENKHLRKNVEIAAKVFKVWVSEKNLIGSESRIKDQKHPPENLMQRSSDGSVGERKEFPEIEPKKT